jgi:hypothetical protein
MLWSLAAPVEKLSGVTVSGLAIPVLWSSLVASLV